MLTELQLYYVSIYTKKSFAYSVAMIATINNFCIIKTFVRNTKYTEIRVYLYNPTKVGFPFL